MPRVLVLVMDSAGVGALPDAAAYHDAPRANTIGNVAESLGGLALPNFERLGLGHLTGVRGLSAVSAPLAAVGRLRERSKGKDTITGHWEMTGVVTEVPFPTYPEGFPPEVVEAFTSIVGKPPLGNVRPRGPRSSPSWARSTSAPAGPSSTPRPTRCSRSRPTRRPFRSPPSTTGASGPGPCSSPPHEVNRVIARPFVGSPGNYKPAPNRRATRYRRLRRSWTGSESGGVPVHAVGKICDIFSGHGIVSSARVADNGEARSTAHLALASC